VEERIVTRRENAYMVVTLRKRVAALWWTSLAKHPEQFKTLIARDFTRGDAEPDPDEDGDVEQVRVGVDAHGKPVAKQTEEEKAARQEEEDHTLLVQAEATAVRQKGDRENGRQAERPSPPYPGP